MFVLFLWLFWDAYVAAVCKVVVVFAVYGDFVCWFVGVGVGAVRCVLGFGIVLVACVCVGMLMALLCGVACVCLLLVVIYCCVIRLLDLLLVV